MSERRVTNKIPKNIIPTTQAISTMKKALLFCISCLLAIQASAMPARPGTFTVRQSDGTVLTLQMVGDEHFHYFLDVNSGRRMQLADNGDYTVIPEQEFVRRQAAAKERLSMTNALRMERMAKFQSAAGISMNPAELFDRGPHKTVGKFNNHLNGQKKGLVILVNFADLEHTLDDPQMEWDAAFNEVGYTKNDHVGSVHDYFYDQSYGCFDLEFDVVGPVTVSKAMKYYGQNNSYGSDAHAAEMVAEACKLVNNYVNFKDYDWDGDGEVDQVYVIYAGYGESSGAPAETIWPHEYWLEYGYGQKLSLDGVYVNTYACSCELRGNGRESKPVMTGIGTACHEFSHCIGFPDFYDVDYGGVFGMDEWDVLGNGGYNGPSFNCEVPVGYTAYERWMAGWLEPTELTEGCNVENMPTIFDKPVAYLLRNKNKGTIARPIDEYFLLENRQNQKWYTYPKGSHGLLNVHVNYSNASWMQNQVNTDASQPRMSIVPAGKTFGTYDAKYKNWYPTEEEYRSMLFPGSRKVTEWTDESHYNCGAKLYNRNTNGTYTLGIPITEIVEDTQKGTISFVVKGGPDLGYRWNVSFETGSAENTLGDWKQKDNGESIVLPEVKSAVPGWRFFGWSKTPVAATHERPADLLLAGTKFKPTADVTLYAVYGVGNDGPLVDEYLYTETFEEGQNYLLLSKNASSSTAVVAVNSDALTLGTATKNSEGMEVSVDFEATPAVCASPASSIIWTLRSDGDNYMFVNGAGKYLSITSGGLSISDTPCYVYWDNSYGLYGKITSGGSYYIHTSSGKFSVSATKQKGSRVYLYAMSDFSNKVVTYTTSPLPLEGIHDVLVGTPAPSALYDLQGRRANATGKGIFIQGGRKVIR